MNKKVCRKSLGLSYTLAILCIVAMICSAIFLPKYKITIDKQILGDGIDVSEYDPEDAIKVAKEVEAEGIILVENNGDALPLKNVSKVVLWGLGSAHMAYTGYGSGAGDATGAITLKQALESEGVSVYQDLYDYYDGKGTTGNTGSFDSVGADTSSLEINPDNVSQAIKDGARAFSDTAIYVLSRVGAENGVMDASDLALSVYEERTLDYVTANFKNVIVLLNTANQFEFGFLKGVGVSRNTGEEFSKYAGKIDAALWVGAPGAVGTYSIAEALVGKINPSGRFADTYAYSVESSPAAQNYFSQKFTDMPSIVYTNYIEGVYVGYKWYETAAFEGAIDYDDYSGTPSKYTDGTVPMGVQYPFGYGLSYNRDGFKWEIVSGTTDVGTTFDDSMKNSSITVNVKVTNVGSVAGKDVVQCYYTPPYQSGGIEKAYVNLVGFAKTPVLYPSKEANGEDKPNSATVSITFDLYDMASYDDSDANKNEKVGYELESGDYYVKLLKNSHDWTNVGNDSSLSLKYTVTEDIHFDKSLVTGAKVVNQFEDLDGGIEFLSRKDGFENASVVKQVDHKTTDYKDRDGKTDLVSRTNVLTDGPYAGETYDYKEGVDYAVDLGKKTIKLADMVDVDYSDKKWDEFVSQLTKGEMAELIAYGNYATSAIERLGVPKTLQLDGPSGIKSTFSSGAGTLLQPAEVVVASTWNQDTAKAQGESFGNDAVATNVAGWYAPSVNIHRAPFNGRNYEYYSEDALLSGVMATNVTVGAQSKGLNVTLKHLLLYCDAATTGWKWCTEQATREIYLKPFQIGIEKGGARQLMTSNSFNGIWVGCSNELLNNVIRGEFGFEGMVTSDAATALFWVQKGVRGGNDLWLSFDNSRRVTLVKEKNIDALKTACKNILFAVSRSTIAMKGNVKEASWSPSTVALVVIELLAAAGLAALVLSIIKKTKRAKAEGFSGENAKLDLIETIVMGVSILTFTLGGTFFTIANISRNLFDVLNRPISNASLIVMICSLVLFAASTFARKLFKKKN